ncbi:hypothetical protein [Thioalkalivibrio halophilus]|uniref:Uncharacterized protein n=1 Tax=Thioalkalivibrio halophilus TaxID=252474 RepID=A0A1V3A1W7_9GAMM|nr:hypothetical protein [Thioalkalivibrio halophilus]OOC11335.1 hypothetical protein B1A74_00750 [Thioalkalivibrio halophilus]
MNTKQAEIPARYSSDWIESLDGRTRLAQAARARLDALQADLGGADALSYQRRSLAKRIVWLEVQIEQREAALARGEEIDEARHTNNVNTLVGLLKSVGLDRKAKDVPDLATYLQQRSEAAQ